MLNSGRESLLDSDLAEFLLTRPRLIQEVSRPIDDSEVLRYLGYPHGHSPDEAIANLIDRWSVEAGALAEPRAAYLVLPVLAKSAGRLRVRSARGEVEFHGAIGQFLGEARMIMVFIATAGPKIERLASRLMDEGEALPAMIVGAVGSERAEAAESAAIDCVGQRIGMIDLAPTLPYSPGYCGMELTQQQELFRLFRGNTAGVRLTPQCQMIPIKSVSGLVGLAPRETVLPGGSPCDRCELTHCQMRRPSRWKRS